MKPYPSVRKDDLQDVVKCVEFIARERDKDIRDWNNLPQIYMRGRKVGHIPASSTDVIDGDRVGDFNYTDAYFYIMVDTGIGAAWRRIALGVW